MANQCLIKYWGEDMLGSEAARQATALRQKLEYYASIGVTRFTLKCNGARSTPSPVTATSIPRTASGRWPTA